MNGEHTNAVAGPSTLPAPTSSTSYPPLLFLPPPPPPPPRQYLASTQDLLARFHLLPAYDRYVRPFTLPGDDPAFQDSAGPSIDKGKGREREAMSATTPAADADGADGPDPDDDDALGAKGEKKKKNSYKHLIKGVPGKHSLKKDDYLTSMMLVPPKQRTRIRHFDARTQEDAFTVSLEGLKGWNVNTLFVESAQAREDRKKRKELKRLAKLQGLQGGPTAQAYAPGSTPTAVSVGTPLPSSAGGIGANDQPLHAPVPVAAPRKMSGAGTPKAMGTPRPGVGTPRPGSRLANGAGSAGGAIVGGGAGNGAVAAAGGGSNGVPRSSVPRPGSTAPRPGSAVPRPGSAVSAAKAQQQQRAHQRPGVNAPPPPRTGTPMDVDSEQRGHKRVREDGGIVPVHTGGNPNPYAAHAIVNGAANGVGHGGAHGNGNGNGLPRPGVMNAKAGTGNIRPRPVKKQRMDMQGQARDVSQPVQQQPTPQGV